MRASLLIAVAGLAFAAAPKGPAPEPPTPPLAAWKDAIARLASSSPAVRRGAVDEVAAVALKLPDAITHLSAILLTDRDPATRLAAANTLAEIGPSACVVSGRLAQALKDPDKAVRAAVAKALGEMGPLMADAVPALAAALKDEDAVVRQKAATTLGCIGPGASAALPALRIASKSADKELVWRAEKAIRKILPKK